MIKFFRHLFIGILFLLFMSFGKSYAQGSSNKGTDFWLGYGTHISTGNMVLYITSDVNTTSTVTIPSLGFSQTVNVTANTVQSVNIPTTAHLTSEGISKNGIHVTSLKPVIVYAHIYAMSVSGATLVLPTNTLGKDYYSINYKQISNQPNCASYFFVVAIEDNTEVEIIPSQATQGGWAANSTNVVKLNKGEIYNVLGTVVNVGNAASTGVDLTGSRIRSISSSGTCKKIAVFSGSSKIAINCLAYNLPTTGNPNPGSADNLFQQIYSTATWGKNFITVPQKDRNFVVYRIVKSDPIASVTLNGAVIPSANFINNFYYDFDSQKTDIISSDKPIQVVQYAVTSGRSISCGAAPGDVGDPEMIFLNPLEQTLTKITMYSTPEFRILKHYINVVVKNEGVASFKVDGVSVSSNFIAVPNSSTHSYAQLEVTSGTHNLVSNEGFNAIAYGFGTFESYGYAAGANLTAFGIETIDDATKLAIQTGCQGQPLSLTLKLPYQPTDLYLDMGDGAGEKQVPIKLLTQTTVDGQTTYNYLLTQNLILTLPKTYSFKVRVIKPTLDNCGAGDEFNFDLIVNPKPVANFNAPSKVCLNDISAFVYISDAAEPSISDYLWDFNGEGISALKDANFTFLTAGIKKVKFSTKSTSGCWSDVVEKQVEIFALPTPNFTTNTPTCETKEIQFTDQSTTIGQTIVKWEWNFDDPTSTTNTSTLQNPLHTFSIAKTYNVSLTVTTDLGCVKVLVKQVIVNPQPKVDFETPEICLDDALATFTNKTTIQGSTVLSYLWDFGDVRPGSVNTSSLANPSHKYIRADNYLVKLITTTDKGCVTELIKTFTVNGSTPKALFIPQNENSLCVNQPIIFKDTSTIDFGEITKIEWYFDDATPAVVEIDNSPNLRSAVAKKYSHTYPIFYSPAQRSVNVKMVAYSGNSATCISPITKTIILKAAPIANFTLPDGCLANGEAQFTDASTFLGVNTGLTYLWNFGDSISGTANTSNLPNPIHRFQSSKDYTITLIVTAPNGCSAVISKVFKVKGAIAEPIFSVINENALCSSNQVVFSDLSKISFGEVTKIEWNFDIDNQQNNPLYQLIDNTPSSRTEIAKTYSFLYPVFASPLTKAVNVKMKVFSGIDCVTEIIKTIELKATPKVLFNNMVPVCEELVPYQITEAKETTGFIGTGIFSGKGVSSTGIFSPADAGVGTHTITYTFTGDNGCSDQASKDITVFPTPLANAGTDETILIGGNIKLNATASGNNVTYKWSPSVGLSDDTALNPTASPVEDTKYTLTVTSENGCEIVDEVFIKVLKYPEIPNTFTPNGDGVNDTWEIKYLGSYPNSTIIIFNRYGKDVYKADSYTAWDGKLNGINLPDGMYYYIITANAGQLKYTGSVMLMR